MIKIFSKYASVGVLNTLLHWLVFYALLQLTELSQAISNMLAFSVAVTFSFIVNAKVTFNSHISLPRYVSYTLFMGLLSYATGAIADHLLLHPIVTLVVFSAISLICGFLYSHFLIFKQPPT